MVGILSVSMQCVRLAVYYFDFVKAQYNLLGPEFVDDAIYIY